MSELVGAGTGGVALSFRGVCFSYGGPSRPPVVRDLSWDVAAGRITGLLGPNGCGKSTLLRLADAAARPSAGRIFVADPDAPAGAGALVPLESLAPARRARCVSLLMQIHRTPSMTVEDLVLCGRYAHLGAFGRASAEDRLVAWQAMADVGIVECAARPARSLSGGQRQRAFIAMALAQQAGVLLLDEPITFLDPRAARDTMVLVERLVRERGLTVLAVLHDVDLALRCCEDVAVMDGGRIVDSGARAEVLARGALERVLDVRIVAHDSPEGPSYAVF